MDIQHVNAHPGRRQSFVKVFVFGVLLAFCQPPAVARAQAAGVIPEIKEPEGEQEAEDCVKCHMKVTPALVAMFQASTMGKKGVQNSAIYEEVKKQRAPKEETETREGFLVRKGQITCVLCHGNDHSTITETSGRVADAVCGGCHDAIDEEYNKGGGHTFDEPAQSWTRALDNPEFAGLPLPVLQLSRDFRFSQHGATQPPYYEHDPEYERSGLVLRNGCDSCHTRHLFSAAEARKPQACKTCHGGAGDSVYDAYRQSKHGSIYDTQGEQWDWEMTLPEAYARGEYKTPTCAYCHMLVKERYGSVRTTHNMTRKGIWKRGLQPMLVEDSKAEAEPYKAHLLEIRKQGGAKRDEMTLVCRNCHSEKFARRYLDAADQVKSESDLLVLQARSVIDGLVQAGLFPKTAPLLSGGPEQTSGQVGVSAPLRTEENPDVAAIWSVYSRMALYHNVRTGQGAFHQSPRDVLWNGYAVVQNDLQRINELAAGIRSHPKN
jgi:hydroxylamine dehydrogenase